MKTLEDAKRIYHQSDVSKMRHPNYRFDEENFIKYFFEFAADETFIVESFISYIAIVNNVSAQDVVNDFNFHH